MIPRLSGSMSSTTCSRAGSSAPTIPRAGESQSTPFMNSSAAILLVALAFPTSLPVQGIVRGENGEPVQGALVFLYSEGRWLLADNELAVRTVTGPTGRFSISEPETKPLLPDFERVLLAYKPGI